MKNVLVVLSTSLVVSVVGAGACSEFKPGSYEGGGRSSGTIVNGTAGSSCVSNGGTCQSSDECCSGNCNFNGANLLCEPASDGAAQCAQNGQACTSATQCCSNYCSPGQLCATQPVQDSGGGG